MKRVFFCFSSFFFLFVFFVLFFLFFSPIISHQGALLGGAASSGATKFYGVASFGGQSHIRLRHTHRRGGKTRNEPGTRMG